MRSHQGIPNYLHVQCVRNFTILGHVCHISIQYPPSSEILSTCSSFTQRAMCIVPIEWREPIYCAARIFWSLFRNSFTLCLSSVRVRSSRKESTSCGILCSRIIGFVVVTRDSTDMIQDSDSTYDTDNQERMLNEPLLTVATTFLTKTSYSAQKGQEDSREYCFHIWARCLSVSRIGSRAVLCIHSLCCYPSHSTVDVLFK